MSNFPLYQSRSAILTFSHIWNIDPNTFNVSTQEYVKIVSNMIFIGGRTLGVYKKNNIKMLYECLTLVGGKTGKPVKQ